MSFKQSLYDQLKSKLPSKNIFIFKGNTMDYIYPETLGIKFPKNKEIKGIDYLNLAEYLSVFLHNEDYKKIEYYAPSFKNAFVEEGRIKFVDKNNESNEEGIEFEKEEDDFGLDEEEIIETKFPNFTSFINYIKSDLQIYYEKPNDVQLISNAYIIDLSEFILNEKNAALNLEQVGELIEMFTTFFNQRTSNYIKSKLKLIIILNNSDIFTSLWLKHNSEIQYINIPKPDKNERRDFFIKLSKVYINEPIDIEFEENTKKFNEALSITDGLSYREILQLVKVLHINNSNATLKPLEDFKSIYRLVNFDKKDSEWEKIGIEKIKNLESEFKKRIQGQDEAIERIKKTLIRSFVGLQGITQSGSENSNKPRGILFLAGPTGVGKTEIVKTLSEFIFGDEKKIIRFDMSEYNHDESDQKLIGSAPGYVGYEEGGQLTNAVLEKPFSILLFDEIEKANGKILDKFLQILEDGRLTSSKGELVDFSETFIVFTSNIGADTYDETKSPEEIRKHFKTKVVEYFTNQLGRPEILNRIGTKNIVPFNPITQSNVEICKNILKHKLEKIIALIYEKKSIKIKPDKEQQDKLFDLIINYFNSKMGGRGLVTQLETFFIDPLSKFVFDNYEKLYVKENSKEFKTINFTVGKTKIDFKIEN